MTIRYLLTILISTVLVASGGRLKADDKTSAETAKQAAIADVLIASLDVVFSKHVDPPTRGELLRRGIKGMFTRAGVSHADSLGRRISDLQPAEYTQLLREMIGIARRTGVTDEPLQVAFLSSLLEESRVRNELSESRYVPEKEYRVQQQIRENRYVGIGIALAQIENRPVMAKVLPGGPASKCGVRDGDIIVTIDGAVTEGMQLGETVELLRGGEGEALTLTVRQKDEATVRTLELVRGEVPFETVVGRVRETEGWRYDIEPTNKIAYVKITSIRGSTVGELRQTARRLRRANFGALLLDLRQTADGDLRHTIFLADELLGEAPLGTYTDAHGTHDVASNAESLLPEMPVAVLIDATMPDGARWIAATLQDNERGVLVGTATPVSDWYANELTKLPARAGALLLPTAILRRPQPVPSPDRVVIQWIPSARPDGSRYVKREHELAPFLQQPGSNGRSLIPDHYVTGPRFPGNRRAVNPSTNPNPNPTEDVAIEVLLDRLNSVGADAIAE